MDFWMRFVSLCSKIGIKPNTVGEILGITSIPIIDWKMGILPQGEILVLLSDYFGVSVDYLLGREGKYPEKPKANTICIFNRDGSRIEKQLTEKQLEDFATVLENIDGK